MVDVQPYHAAGVPDGPQLAVRQIPADVTQGAAVGVGGDDRPPGQVHHVPEAGVVQVGHVHQHMELPHPPDHRPARGGEFFFGVAAGPGGQGVLLVPGQHPQPHAGFIAAVQGAGVRSEGGHALDAQKGVELPRLPGSLRLPDRTDQLDL